MEHGLRQRPHLASDLHRRRMGEGHRYHAHGLTAVGGQVAGGDGQRPGVDARVPAPAAAAPRFLLALCHHRYNTGL
jgi:hypothetical protein